jgi:hypothetical protein
VVTVVKTDFDVTARSYRGGRDGTRLHDVAAHRLFQQHVLSARQGRDRDLGQQAVRRCDTDDVDVVGSDDVPPIEPDARSDLACERRCERSVEVGDRDAARRFVTCRLFGSPASDQPQPTTPTPSTGTSYRNR